MKGTNHKKGSLVFFAYLTLFTLAVLNFEAVFALPLFFIRAGAKLKLSDIMSVVLTGLYFANVLYYRRMAKNYQRFLVVFAILLFCSYVGPAIFLGYMYISEAWFFLSFTSSFALYDFLQRRSTPYIMKLLNRYLTVAFVLYLFAFIDYLVGGFTKFHLIPALLDQRMHQMAGPIPRFEGYSPLALAFIPLGYFHFVLAILFRRKVVMYFFLFLMLLSVSVGGLVAGTIAFSYYLFTRLSKRTRLLLFLPVFWVALFVVGSLVQFKIATSGRWSYGVRLEFYMLTPTILTTDPLGMGFGQSRYVGAFAKRYAVDRYETLFVKSEIEGTVVVESSHLEIIYEFGFVGIALFVLYTWAVLKYCLMALKIDDRRLLLAVSVLLFFYVHAFFNPSYFYQGKFYILNLLALLLVSRFKDDYFQKTSPDLLK